jgi:hypothetical protein
LAVDLAVVTNINRQRVTWQENVNVSRHNIFPCQLAQFFGQRFKDRERIASATRMQRKHRLQLVDDYGHLRAGFTDTHQRGSGDRPVHIKNRFHRLGKQRPFHRLHAVRFAAAVPEPILVIEVADVACAVPGL